MSCFKFPCTFCACLGIGIAYAHGCEVSANRSAPHGCALPNKLANFKVGLQLSHRRNTARATVSQQRNTTVIGLGSVGGHGVAGYFECSNDVVVGRPRTMSELQAQVQQYDHVKAVGVGHSWWQQQFCSGSDSSSVNIVLTQMDTTLTE